MWFTSTETSGKILSSGNHDLLRVIVVEAPGLLDDLARIIGCRALPVLVCGVGTGGGAGEEDGVGLGAEGQRGLGGLCGGVRRGGWWGRLRHGLLHPQAGVRNDGVMRGFAVMGGWVWFER